MRASLLTAALVFTAISVVAQESESYKGRLLADVLRALQAKGLRIVFSSATVTPDMRVTIEPGATNARQQLDKLLEPHGLKARDGPGGTIQIVRVDVTAKESSAATVGTIDGSVVDLLTGVSLPDVVIGVDSGTREVRTDAAGRFLLRRVPAGSRVLRASATGYTSETQAVQMMGGTTAAVTLRLSPSSHHHNEYVSVRRPAPHHKDPGVASETNLDRSQLQRLYGSLADDPVRAVQTLPRVMPIDDFRSEFSVRGSPFRHVEFVVDGVPAQWLQHTAHRRGATGSLPMLAGHVLETATLRAGAYPRRHGDRLGPQLDLMIREGSRDRFTWRGAVGGTNASVFGEGPLGTARRGSWLAAIRQSYLEWPTERAESTRTAFGFWDGLAKVAYDVHPSHQFALTVLGGTSNIDVEEESPTNDLESGRNRGAMVNLSWRSILGSGVVLRQRVYVVRQNFLNKHLDGSTGDHGANAQAAYRADLTRPIARGLLEGGVHVGRTAIHDAWRSPEARPTQGSSWLRSGYAHFEWAATPTLTLSPGARVTASTRSPHTAVSRWFLGEWLVRHDWTLSSSAGVSQQLPELRHTLGEAGSRDLRPEGATYFDVAIEQRLASSIRWQATAFSRKERDILREADSHPRLVGDILVPPRFEPYVNALEGTSRGIELLIDRQSATGLSGWASYSYARTRYTDMARGETYWGDFDQRHTLSVFGAYRFSARTNMGATFRAGSNFPIPGYLAAREGRLFVATARNRVRLPTYARLDLRADHSLNYLGHRLVLFVELINLLNRANAGLANGSVDMPTGEAVGFTDELFRRRASAGVVVEF